MAEIVEAQTKPQIAQVQMLFRAYRAEMVVPICFAEFDGEIETLPGLYAPPKGALMLATVSGQPAGCVALRPYPAEGVGEMKRLYVRPTFRGDSLGVRLIERILQEARARGCRRLRLDSHPPSMGAAIAHYRRMGFSEVHAICNAEPWLLYMERQLLPLQAGTPK